MRVKLTDQLELLAHNPTEEELEEQVGKDIGRGVILLTAPKWSNFYNAWTALADVCGMLGVVEVNVRSEIQ